MKTINSILFKLGYLPKSDFDNILDSFDARQKKLFGYINLCAKDEETYHHNIYELFNASFDEEKDARCFYQYIFDAGIKSIKEKGR